MDPDGRNFWDIVQGGLDAVGVIPGVGEVADLANAGISLARGDYIGAGLSLVSMVPIVGDVIGKGGKVARAAVKHGDEIAGAVTAIAKNIDEAADGVREAGKSANRISDVAKQHTPDQQALNKLAKEAKQNSGVSPTDAETLVDWADEVGLPARSTETHPNRPYGKEPHIHVGSVDHIPVKVSQE